MSLGPPSPLEILGEHRTYGINQSKSYAALPLAQYLIGTEIKQIIRVIRSTHIWQKRRVTRHCASGGQNSRSPRQGHCLQPAQRTEFAAWVTRAAEDHKAQ